MSPADSDRTSRHFDQELGEVRELLLEMASRAEEQVRSALLTVKQRDAQDATGTVDADQIVDALEVQIEDRAISLLARRQPMAIDLRMLVAILKISNDLERVGDHAVNIAKCAQRLAESFPIATPEELDGMADVATGMLRDSITAFIDQDSKLAREILLRDDQVDRSNDAVFRVMLAMMAENSNTIVAGLQMMLVARNLERVADLATNISEDVIYIVEARSIKHHAEEKEGGWDH